MSAGKKKLLIALVTLPIFAVGYALGVWSEYAPTPKPIVVKVIKIPGLTKEVCYRDIVFARKAIALKSEGKTQSEAQSILYRVEWTRPGRDSLIKMVRLTYSGVITNPDEYFNSCMESVPD